MKNLNLKVFIATIIVTIGLFAGSFVVYKKSHNEMDEINREVTKYNALITAVQNKQVEKPKEVKDYKKYLDVYPIDIVSRESIDTFFTAIELKNGLTPSVKKYVNNNSESCIDIQCEYHVFYKDLNKYLDIVDEVVASDVMIDNSGITIKEVIENNNDKKEKYYDLTISYKLYYFSTGTNVE